METNKGEALHALTYGASGGDGLVIGVVEPGFIKRSFNLSVFGASLLFILVLIGLVPALVSLVQFLIVGLHAFHNNYGKCANYTPRVAFILPAWNEADVLNRSIDSLMALSYPSGAWRIYVVDDASTDETPQILQKKMDQYPGSIFYLRREVGGQGKAHTLNYGLRTILAEDFAEAVMIMDADVLFEPLALRRMPRHLANPKIGAVTAYIKEGSYPGNFITRFIAYEYTTAQAAVRRVQNVAGSMICLAGGAQLHSREIWTGSEARLTRLRWLRIPVQR